jgi:hypothetical protein
MFGAIQNKTNFSGGEFLLGLGFHIRAGTYVRLVPKIQMLVGSFSNDNEGKVTQSGVHVMFNFGLSGFFDLDLDKPAPTPTAPPAK